MKYHTLNYLLATALLGCLVASFWPAFLKMFHAWSGDDHNYAYWVIPLFLYLGWDIRKRFRFQELSWSYWGGLPIILAVLLILTGELGSVVTLMFAGIWLGLVGILVSLYGWRVKQLLFPIIVLLFIVPLPPFITNMLTFQLKLAASALSVAMLRLFGTSVVLTGNVIDLGARQLQVVDACSGLRFFVPMILISLLVGYFFARGWWRRAVLFVMALPLSIFFNALRIFVTGMLTDWGYTKLADSFFHDFSGLVIFGVASLFLVLLAFLLNRIGDSPLESQKRPDHNNQAHGRHKPLLITAVMGIFFILGGWTLQALPSANHIPQRTLFAQFPMQIEAWQGQRRFLPEKILNSLWADDYVSAVYKRHDIPNRIHLFIPFYTYQATRHTAHAPQACMLGGGWSMSSVSERAFEIPGGRSEKIMTMVWENSGVRLLGSYFFLQRGRVITSPWLNKWYLVWDAVSKRRTDGALVRVEMAMMEGQTVDEAFVLLKGFIFDIWPVLPAFVPS